MNRPTLLRKSLPVWCSCAVFAALFGIVSGCGQSGDSVSIAGVGTGGTGSVSITGKVADGYLANASVFLDRNGNYQLDADEPFTTTDAHGAYRLNLGVADVGRYPIVALALKGVAIDQDTDRTIANSYVLSTPKESVSSSLANNFISPLTSQLREIMETGLFTGMPQAMEALRTRMGLPPGTDLMSDYVADNNMRMHSGAQNIAALMGNQMGQIFISNGSSTTVDVNRYRGMMGIIYGNMSTIVSANSQAELTQLNSGMTTILSGMSPMRSGMPYQNMSSSFKSRTWGMKIQ